MLGGSRTLALALLLLTAVAVAVSYSVAAQPEVREPLWSIPDSVNDVAISSDGSIVAIATPTELRVYDAGGNLLWSYTVSSDYEFTAVDVSDDGNAVVACIYDASGSVTSVEFWRNAKSLSGSPEPSWSDGIGFEVEAEALAVSGDGDHVAIAQAVYISPDSISLNKLMVSFWNETLSLTGSQSSVWSKTITLSGRFLRPHISMSRDGGTLAVSVYDAAANELLVYVFRDLNSNPTNLTFRFSEVYWYGGLALSDDGRYLAVGLGRRIAFIDAVSGEILWNSTNLGDVAAVDISGDGETVVAAANIIAASPITLAIFHNAPSKSGSDVAPDAVFEDAVDYTDYDYMDVSVDDGGRIAVAGTGDYVFAVNTSTGELLWYYGGVWPAISKIVKVSGDGRYVVTAGEAADSAYLFSTGLTALAPPAGVVGGELEVPPPSNSQPWIAALAAAAAAGTIAYFLIRRK